LRVGTPGMLRRNREILRAAPAPYRVRGIL
jgi:hypothetical protein